MNLPVAGLWHLATGRHPSFEVKGVAPREGFYNFLGDSRMLLPELMGSQHFHLLKIGGGESGVRGVEIIL